MVRRSSECESFAAQLTHEARPTNRKRSARDNPRTGAAARYYPDGVLAAGSKFAGYRILVYWVLGHGGGLSCPASPVAAPRRVETAPARRFGTQTFGERFNPRGGSGVPTVHPNIVGVHARGEFNGQLRISMDYVDGIDAARLFADRYPAGMPVQLVAAM